MNQQVQAAKKLINAGIFLIKNRPWAFGYLKEVQAKTEWYHQGPLFEQGAMWQVALQDKYMSRTLFLHNVTHFFNLFPQKYESGDFIVHFKPDKCSNLATMIGLAAADRLLQGKKVFAHQLL